MDNALAIAFREVSETKSLLEGLIKSSESFDYIKAKDALKKLQRKSRELSKLQSQLALAGGKSNITVVNFSRSAQSTPAPQVTL